MLRRWHQINLFRFSLVTLSMTVLVILWGAYVRATGAGAGCGNHWPLCNGAIVPRLPIVETLVEFTHRITSALAFLLVLGQWVIVRKKYASGHRMRFLAALAMLFMVFEALIGAVLVLFDLVALNTSFARAAVGSLHLLNTFILLAMITLVADGSRFQLEGRFITTGMRFGFLLAGILGMLLIGMSGAIAALGDTLFPSESFLVGLAQELTSDAHLLIRLRVWHPFIAVIATLLVFVGLRLSPPGNRQPPYLRLILAILLSTQLLIGVINVLLLAPVFLQIVHLLLADLIWIGLIVYANHSQREID